MSVRVQMALKYSSKTLVSIALQCLFLRMTVSRSASTCLASPQMVLPQRTVLNIVAMGIQVWVSPQYAMQVELQPFKVEVQSSVAVQRLLL